MPAYEFEVVNEASGETLATLTLPLPIEQRDNVTIKRRTVPRSVAVAGVAGDPFDQGKRVLEGYRRAEEKMGSRFKSEFTPDQVRRAMALPDAD